MKNLSKKVEFARLNFAVLAVAFVCFGMWGCGLFDEEVTTTVNEERSGGMPIALLDDSLAIVYNSRGREEHAESCNYYSSCDYGVMNQGVFLVNYREKRAPYWGDTTKGVLYIAKGLAYDSTVIFYKDDGCFGLWKVGENLDVRKKIKWNDGCAWKDFYTQARPWQNGNVLLKDVYPCPYAVLDTATGNVKKLEFNGENSWLEGCDDITYMDGGVVCLKALYAENRYGVYKYVNNEFSDSLIWQNAFWSEYTKNVLEIRGNMFTIKHPTETIDYKSNVLNGTYIHSISPLGTSDFPIRIDAYNFINSSGNSISYSSEDLIVTK